MIGWKYALAGMAGIGGLIATANVASAPPLAKLAAGTQAAPRTERDDEQRQEAHRDPDEARAPRDKCREREDEDEREDDR